MQPSLDGEKRVRVMLVDDHALVAESLQRALRHHPDLEVVGIASTLAEAKEAVVTLRPDVVVLDHRLPDAVGAPAIRALLAVAPDIRIVTCTGYGDLSVARAALDAGAAGYVDKTHSLATLTLAIRTVAMGERYCSIEDGFPPEGDRETFVDPNPESASRIARRGLSAREVEVLALIGEGTATREVAARLGISEHTVRKHVQTILGKLDAHSKLEAVARARRLGVIDDVPRDR